MKFLIISISILSIISPLVYADDNDLNFNQYPNNPLSALSAEELKMAEFLLKQKVAQEPENPICYQALGSFYMNVGKLEESEANFKKAVALDPKLCMSWYNLAILRMGDKQGDEYLKGAITYCPDYAPPYYWLAYKYIIYGKDKEAISLLEEYLKVANEQDTDEIGRIEVANKVLKELYSGEDGEALKKIRSCLGGRKEQGER